MAVSVLPLVVFAADTGSDPIVVIACSDFQNPGSGLSDYSGKNKAGAATVTSILTKMKAGGITTADGFICCGDYDHENNAGESVVANEITALKGAVETAYPKIATNAA